MVRHAVTFRSPFCDTDFEATIDFVLRRIARFRQRRVWSGRVSANPGQQDDGLERDSQIGRDIELGRQPGQRQLCDRLWRSHLVQRERKSIRALLWKHGARKI